MPANGTRVPRVITLRAGQPRVEITETVHRNDGADALPRPLVEPFAGKPYVRASRIDVIDE